MNEIFKPYLPGTIEEYSYQVDYEINGAMFYMNVFAENEIQAASKVKKQYFKDESINIIKVKGI